MEEFIVNYGLITVYIIFAIATLSALVFPAIQLFQDLKKALTALIGIVALVVIYLLCYVMASSEPLTVGDKFVSAETMKFVEANIYLAYAMFGVSVLAIVYASVSRYFK